MDKIFRIKRFDPEKDNAARWEDFPVELGPHERLLDGLVRTKEFTDGSLTFRRSCAHGMCGSCAMKINGRSRLACQTLAGDMPELVVFEPLPAFPVIKDLVVDMEPFFEKIKSVMPYLVNDEPLPSRERPQSPEEMEKILDSIRCILCACCTSSCPVYWGDKQYLGPAALVKAARFVLDSRDRGGKARLDLVSGAHGAARCHSIYNCVEACPRDIDVTRHIAILKRQTLKRGLRGAR
ncbi:MAG: succinate dehydrogenase iron-sulfur subunit [Nitrospiraceae bacterium]|nr:succinate dehydrogenase iron-sulfur subunit [Nitrospiraceae bacterium]